MGVNTEGPFVSVVVTSVGGLECVSPCLEALERQLQPALAEILVVDRCGEATRAALRAKFPFAQVLTAEKRALREMRIQGLRHARGSLVAVLADRFVTDEGWLAALVREGRSGRPIVGGSIEPRPDGRWVDWAVFFCEYAAFMPPQREGLTSSLAGNNVAYSRRALNGMAEALARGSWDTALHSELRAAGLALWLAPGMRVTLARRHDWRAALVQRYLAGRAFAAFRVAGWRGFQRLAYALVAPVLPVLLMWRIADCVARRQRHRVRLMLASPVILTLLYAGAWGEFAGASWGAGDSLERLD